MKCGCVECVNDVDGDDFCATCYNMMARFLCDRGDMEVDITKAFVRFHIKSAEANTKAKTNVQ